MNENRIVFVAVQADEDDTKVCGKCVFRHSGICDDVKCVPSERQDGKYVYFVREDEE